MAVIGVKNDGWHNPNHSPFGRVNRVNKKMDHPTQYRWNLLATCSAWTYTFDFLCSIKQQAFCHHTLNEMTFLIALAPMNAPVFGTKWLDKSRQQNHFLALPRVFFCASWGLIPRNDVRIMIFSRPIWPLVASASFEKSILVWGM